VSFGTIEFLFMYAIPAITGSNKEYGLREGLYGLWDQRFLFFFFFFKSIVLTVDFWVGMDMYGKLFGLCT
jgi:hypothetical protein